MEISLVNKSLILRSESFVFSDLVGMYETVDETGNRLAIDVYGCEENLYFSLCGNWPIESEVEYDLMYKGLVVETIGEQIRFRYEFDNYGEGCGHIDFFINYEYCFVDKLEICLPDGQIYTLSKK